MRRARSDDTFDRCSSLRRLRWLGWSESERSPLVSRDDARAGSRRSTATTTSRLTPTAVVVIRGRSGCVRRPTPFGRRKRRSRTGLARYELAVGCATPVAGATRPGVLLIAANAAFREAQREAGDGPCAVQRLDGVHARPTRASCKNGGFDREAAYNYEYRARGFATAPRAESAAAARRGANASTPLRATRCWQRDLPGGRNDSRPARRAAADAKRGAPDHRADGIWRSRSAA